MNNFISLLRQPQFYLPLLLWSISWKGIALWKAANKKQLPWFIILLVINTMGLLEIAYIFFLNRLNIDKGRTLTFFESMLKRTNKI